MSVTLLRQKTLVSERLPINACTGAPVWARASAWWRLLSQKKKRALPSLFSVGRVARVVVTALSRVVSAVFGVGVVVSSLVSDVVDGYNCRCDRWRGVGGVVVGCTRRMLL
jgi:hypothetical protein